MDNVEASHGANHQEDEPPTLQRRAVKRTPAQLEKKRAADREAQRVTRERTKNRIESLEKLVQTLSNTEHSPGCTSALKERDEARAELADVRARLGSIISSLQSVTTPSATAQESDISSHHHNPPNGTSPTYFKPEAQKQSTTTLPFGVGCSVDHSTGTPSSMLSSQKWTNPNSPASTVPSPRYGIPVGTGTLSLAPSRPADYDLSSQISHESIGSIRGWAPQEAQYGNGYGPVWSLLINNVLATCPMDSILLNFIDCRRRALLQGATELVAAGPGYPDFSGLLGLHTGQVKCPISQLLTDVIAKVETLGSLPEQTAVLYIMFSMIRWQILPTLDNYNQIPVWLRPVQSQHTCPHPAWVDYIPWPPMRHIISVNHNLYSQDVILLPWTQTLRINWSYDPDKVLLVNNQTKDVSLNPVFEQHLRRLPNWTLGPRFSQLFPSLKGSYRLVDPAETGKEAGWEYNAT